MNNFSQPFPQDKWIDESARLRERVAQLESALTLSNEVLIETMPHLPNPDYGWLLGKVDARVIRNRALLAKVQS